MKNKFLLILIMLLIGNEFSEAQTERLERMWYTSFPQNYRSEGFSDVVVDEDGFIYATGTGCNLIDDNSEKDFITAKFNPLTGDTIWTRIYHRFNPGGNGFTQNDYAKKIGIDSEGNIYVAGASHTLGQSMPQVYEFIIIKYDLNGNVLWTANSGNNYITYSQYLNNDRFDLCISTSGNIYITSGYVILKYNQTGQMLWGIKQGYTTGYRVLALDSKENVIASGFITEKYSSEGSLLWSVPVYFQGCLPGSASPQIYAITTGDSDNVYVGGFTCANATNNKIISKYSSNGDVIWVKNIDTGELRDEVSSLLLDSTNYLYVGGRAPHFYGGGDPIRKYRINGDLLWNGETAGPIAKNLSDKAVVSFGGQFGGTRLRESQFENGVLLDTALFVYNVNSSDFKTTIVMKNDYGHEQIVSAGQFIGLGSTNPRNVVVVHSRQSLPMMPGEITAAFFQDSIRLNFEDESIIETGFKVQRSSNNVNWTDAVLLPEFNENYPFRGVHTIHNSVGGTGNYFRICAFNENGHSDWIANNGVKYPSTPTELSGNFYISNNSVVLTWKDNSRIETGYKVERKIGGDTLFQEIGIVGQNITEFVDDQLPASVMGEEYFYRVRAFSGSVYSDYSEIVVVTVIPVELISFTASVSNQTVELRWITASETNNRGFEVERKILKQVQDDIWGKIGFKEGSGTTTETKLYSFVDDEVTKGKYQYRLKQIDFDGTFEYSNIVEVEVDFAPREYSLEQNYPNPFNPVTKISWQSPVGSWQILKVYDVLGNEVATLVNEFRDAGSYNIEFNSGGIASGVYYYELKAVDPSTGSGQAFRSVKKMILMK